MAISKIIYKTDSSDTGTVWMDVTQKTVTAGSMLSGTTALKNDGTDITGNIATKTSANLTASGATVTAQAGYYASDASKSVASGSEGTPTATKGTVSNHAVTVTPSVTNTAGYISGGTHSGTGVSVSVSELESGTKEITENGTGISVSGYSAVDVAVPSGGADCPTFTVTHSEMETIISITCDKTYAECVTYLQSEQSEAIVVLDDGEETYTVGATLYSSMNNTLVYHALAGTVVSYLQINYPSSGSITGSFEPIPNRSSSDLYVGNYLTVTAPAGYYASDAAKTLTDANLSAGNIKKDVSIFGVTGTYEGGGGGNGLVYETGTYTPTEDVAQTIISFANTHSTKPFYVLIADQTATSQTTNNSHMFWMYGSWYEAFGNALTNNTNTYYSRYQNGYRGTANTLSNAGSAESSNSTNYVSPTQFGPNTGSSTVYWRTGRTYKWIAVWAPTT